MAKEDKKEDKAIQTQRPQRALSPFEDMDRWFNDMVHSGWMRPFRRDWPSWGELSATFEGRMPKVDVIERDEEVIVRAEVAGVDKKDLDVSVTENSVTIKGETSHESKEEEGDYHRTEISRGSFSRTVALPCEVESEKAAAKFNNGVLELKLPKVTEAKRRSIKIE